MDNVDNGIYWELSSASRLGRGRYSEKESMLIFNHIREDVQKRFFHLLLKWLEKEKAKYTLTKAYKGISRQHLWAKTMDKRSLEMDTTDPQWSGMP